MAKKSGKSGKSNKQNKIDARDDLYAISADSPLKIGGGNSLLGNDVGKKMAIVAVNGVPLGIGKTVTLDSGATLKVKKNGTFDFDPNGQYSHLKAGEVAYETFTYKVMTKKGKFDTATVKIKIEGSNEIPLANEDSFQIAADGKLSVGASSSVLKNDTDANADPLSIVAVNGVAASVGKTITLASGAQVKLKADGTFDYDPNGKFANLPAGGTAIDTFTYKISDGKGGFDTTVVKIRVVGTNDQPLAEEDAFAIAADGKLSVAAANSVLKNDSDVDGDSLAIVAVNGNAAAVGKTITLASGATVKLNADGTFDYDPNGKFDNLAVGDTAIDTFTYRISDGKGGFDTTVVKIRIEGAAVEAPSTDTNTTPPVVTPPPVDSKPTISGTTSVAVDEEGLATPHKGNPGDSYAWGDLPGQSVVAHGTLGVSFGADGPKPGAAIALSADGATWNQGTMTLRANDGAWKIVVDQDGCYTFTLMKPMHHPVAGNEDDICIDVKFSATDATCDTVCGSFQVKVDDDAPVICNPTSIKVDEEGLPKGNAGDSYASGDLPGQAVVATGTLGVSFGADGPKAGGEFVLSAPGACWNAETMTLRADDGSWKIVVAADGCYTFTLMKPMHHPVAGNEDDICINVSFTATDADCDSVCGSFEIRVDDDAPVICNPTSVKVDEEGLAKGNAGDSYASGDLPGQAVVATGTLGVSFGADGPKAGGGFHLSADCATWNAETMTLRANDGAWKIVVDQDGCYTFTLMKPMAHPVAGTEDDLCIDVSFVATDRDCDSVCGSFQIKIDDDAPVICNPTSVCVDEEGLCKPYEGNLGDSYAWGDLPGHAVSATGSLGVSFGADGPKAGGGLALSADHATWNPQTMTLCADDGSWKIIVQENGCYTFVQLKPMHHPVAGNEDDVCIKVSFTATDADCDSVCGSFDVKVDDDAPVVCNEVVSKVLDDAAQLFGIDGGPGDQPGADLKSASGQLDFSAGADGLGSISFGETLHVTDSQGADAGTLRVVVVDPITKAEFEEDVTLHWTQSGAGGTLIGTSASYPAGNPVLKLVVAANGSYTFEVFAPLAHPMTDDPDTAALESAFEDELTLSLNFTITDKDCDPVCGTFTVKIDDDSPVPECDVARVTEGGDAQIGVVSGNVLANDDFGADGFGGLVSIVIDGVKYDFVESANKITKDGVDFALGTSVLQVATALGGTFTLHFLDSPGQAAGDWSYKSPKDVAGDTTEIMSYQLVDGDGDGQSAALKISVEDIPESEPTVTVVKTGPAEIAEGGADVTWTFTITAGDNASSDPVTVTSLSDDKLGDLLPAALAAWQVTHPGATAIVLEPNQAFSFDYNPAGDLVLDGGDSHTNVVTVIAEDDEGNQASDSDDHTITATDEDAPTVTVVKTGPAEIAEGGADVTWTFTITAGDNASTDPVTVTSLLDDKLGDLLPAALAAWQVTHPGATAIVLEPNQAFSFDYNPAGDLVLDGGDSHTNVVTVTAEDDEGNQASDSDDHTITATDEDAPTVTVVKTGPAEIAEGGADVTWTFTITAGDNASTDPVTVTSLVDDKLGDLLPAALAAWQVTHPGATAIVLEPNQAFSFDYNPAGDLVLDGGDSHTNVVTVTAEDDEGNQASDSDDHTITATDEDAPTVTVVKTGPAEIAEGGADVTWTFTITAGDNASTDPVTVTSLSDDKLGDLLPAALAAWQVSHPGATAIVLEPNQAFSFDYNPAGDLVLDGGDSHTNVVTVTAEDDEGNQASDSDDHTITATDEDAPTVTVVKTGPAEIAEGGADVTWTFTITAGDNASTDPVTVTSLLDDKLGDLLPAALAAWQVTHPGATAIVLEPNQAFSFDYNPAGDLVLDGGDSHTNVVTVTAEDDEGNQASDSDDHTITATDEDAPTVTVVKTGPAEIAEGGADVTWTFTITAGDNASTDPVTVTSLSDDKLGDLLPAALAAWQVTHPGATAIVLEPNQAFSFDYNPAGDLVLDGGDSHTNVVTVTAEDDEGNQASDSDDHTITATDEDAPTVTVVKTGPAEIAEGGADVTWTFTITAGDNASTDPVTVTSLVDDKLGDLLPAALAAWQVTHPGATAIVLEPNQAFSFDYNPAGDLVLDGGDSHTNVVTVTAEDDEGNQASDSDDHTITATDEDAPTVTVVKTGPAEIAEGGADVTWTFTITAGDNASTDPVTVTSLVDDKLGDLLPAALAAWQVTHPGATAIVLEPNQAFSFDYNPAGDLVLDGGDSHTNVVTVTAEDDEGNQASDSDDHTITATDEDAPTVTVVKTGPAEIAEGGADVTWTFTITAGDNASTDPVTVTSLVDDKLGDLLPAALAAWQVTHPGATAIVLEPNQAFSFDYNPAGDLVLDGGDSHTNVVTVTAEDDEGNQASDSDDHTITATDEDAPTVTVVKTGPAEIAEGGADVTWTFTITAGDNASTDPVTVTSLSDDKLGDLLPAALAAWQVTHPGATAIVLEPNQAFSFDYNPAGDLVLDGGDSHTNVVTVTAEDDEGNQASDSDDHTITATDEDAPTVTVVKTGPAEIAEGGADVTWTFTITAGDNASTDPVTVTSLLDDKLGDLLPAALAAWQVSHPGATAIVLEPNQAFSFDYNPAGDLVLDGGDSHTNVVTVTAEDDEGNQASDSDDHTITATDEDAPTVTVVKTGPAEIAEGGADVTWTFTITAGDNASTDPVTVTSLLDDKLGDLLPAALAAWQVSHPGATAIVLEPNQAFSFDYNPAGDLVLDGGDSHTNVVTVIAEDDEGNQASDSDDHTIIVDDVPEISPWTIVDDEDQLPAGNNDLPAPSAGDDNRSNVTGSLPIDFGADAAGATISFAALHGQAVKDVANNNVLTSIANAALTYYWDGSSLYASTDASSLANAIATAAFQFEITNHSTGAYEFTLLQALEHAGGVGGDDNTEDPNIELSLAYTATDGEGDAAPGALTLVIDDDIPLAVDDLAVTASETSGPVGANLLTNDEAGADGAVLTHVKLPGSAVFVAITSGTPAGDAYSFTVSGIGTYTFKPDGSWTIDPVVNASLSSQSGTFEYRITDSDGDTDEATQPITINNVSTPLSLGPVSAVVEEEHLDPALSGSFPITAEGNDDTDDAGDLDDDVSGNLNVVTHVQTGSFADAVDPGSIDGTLSFSLTSVTTGQAVQKSGGGTLTSDGETVRYHVSGNTLMGYANVPGGSGGYNAGSDRVVFTLELNPSNGNYTFTLLDNVDHHTVPGADDVEGAIGIDLGGRVRVSDVGDPTPDTKTFDDVVMTVIDDIPLGNEDTATAIAGVKPSVNIVLVIDTSGSMDTSDAGGTRLSLAKAAAINLLNNSDVIINNVMVVNFGSSASINTEGAGVYWTSKGDAINYINGLSANGSTNYDAALNTVMTNWGSGPTEATQTLTYFISDGQPTISNSNPGGNNSGSSTNPELGDGIGEEGINGGDLEVSRQEWEAFLTNAPVGGGNNGVDTAFAIGVGAGVTQGNLEPISWAPGNAALPPVLISSASELSVLLTGSLPGNPSGNVFDDGGGFGADDGAVKAIVVDGVEYTLAANPSGFVAVTTALGGKFVFNFVDNGLNQAGDWEYFSPSNVVGTPTETITYTLVDGDGDEAPGSLDINVLQPPTLSVSSGAATEGDGYMQFSVSLSYASISPVPVTFSTTTGTASAADFGTALEWSLDGFSWFSTPFSFGPGETSVLVRVPIVDDIYMEADESFQLTATASAGTANGVASGTGTIHDDGDVTPPNAAPVGGVDQVYLNGPTGASATLQNAWLLANDTDGDGDPLTVDSAASGTNVTAGSVTPTTTTITYNGNSGSAGAFTYVANDGSDDSASITVNVTRGSDNAQILGGSGNDILIDTRGNEATTLDGGAGNDVIVGGAGNDTIVGEQNDVLLDGGANTDTLQVGANFTSASNAQIANIENVTLTAAGTTLDLSNQTEGFNVTANAGGSTITTGTGGDTINISAGTSATAWSINLGSDSVQDKVVFAHASIGDGHATIATVSNFNVAHDRIAITLNGTAIADGAFTSINATDADNPGEVIELIGTFFNASLTADGNGGAIETVIASAIDDITAGNYTVIVYSDNTASANAGIYTMNVGTTVSGGGANNLGTGGFTLEHIMTLNGVGFGNLTDANFVATADPIILDLQPDGVSFAPKEDGVRFDINADGAFDDMAWTTGGDGILVMDLDGSGAIENGTELLSEYFGGSSHADGLAALATLDDNQDGVIDASDAAFAELLVWQDLDHDGISDAGELRSLSEHGIASISLDAQRTSGQIDGQTVVAEGIFTNADGSTGTFLEVDFDAMLGDAAPAPLVGVTGVADIFRFETADALRLVENYDGGEGDGIDLSALLDAAFGDGDDASDFVQLEADGNDIQVFVDIDGAGDGLPAHIASLLGANTAGDDPVRASFGGQSHVFTV